MSGGIIYGAVKLVNKTFPSSLWLTKTQVHEIIKFLKIENTKYFSFNNEKLNAINLNLSNEQKQAIQEYQKKQENKNHIPIDIGDLVHHNFLNKEACKIRDYFKYTADQFGVRKTNFLNDIFKQTWFDHGFHTWNITGMVKQHQLSSRDIFFTALGFPSIKILNSNYCEKTMVIHPPNRGKIELKNIDPTIFSELLELYEYESNRVLSPNIFFDFVLTKTLDFPICVENKIPKNTNETDTEIHLDNLSCGIDPFLSLFAIRYTQDFLKMSKY